MSARAKNILVARLDDLFKAPCYQQLRLMIIDKANHLADSQTEGIDAFTKWMQSFEKILVKNPNDRFNIDAWLLSSAVSELEKNLVLSKNIIPFYLAEWLYFLPPQPMFKDGNGRCRIYGISFPGSDYLEDLHPLDYAWLYHELGHHIIDRVYPKVFQPVLTVLKGAINVEKRRLPSASAQVRKVINERLKRYEQAWAPESFENWTTEIVSDIISLWCCGPAFLHSYHEAIRGFIGNPFATNSTHLPHALRIRLIIDAGETLSWNKQLDLLHNCDKKWNVGSSGVVAHNEFNAMLQGNLPSVTLNTALEICKGYGLPLCKPASLDNAREWAKTPQPVTSTLQLILGAWVKHSEARQKFDEWERKVIEIFSSELKE
jgi:hypothetical protein